MGGNLTALSEALYEILIWMDRCMADMTAIGIDWIGIIWENHVAAYEEA